MIASPRYRTPAWISSAVIVLAWHLLVPPLVYDKEKDRFYWVSDAPMTKWYHEKEFKTYGDCHDARQAEIVKQEKLLSAKGGQDDPRRFTATTLEQFQNGRCLSDQEVK